VGAQPFTHTIEFEVKLSTKSPLKMSGDFVLSILV
jgi:hypothetical protein